MPVVAPELWPGQAGPRSCPASMVTPSQTISSKARREMPCMSSTAASLACQSVAKGRLEKCRNHSLIMGCQVDRTQPALRHQIVLVVLGYALEKPHLLVH